MRERVMTEPKELVRIEMKNAGFDLDSMQVPKRVYLLADSIYDAILVLFQHHFFAAPGL